MAFSEYQNGQWTGKKVSKDYLASPNILTDTATLNIYPNTTDFVFFPLDIPQENNSLYTGTEDSLESNNNLVIACYQSLPFQAFIDITITPQASTGGSTLINYGGNFSFSIEITLPTGAFDILQLIAAIEANHQAEIILITSGFDFSLVKSQTLYCTEGDPSAQIQSALNAAYIFPYNQMIVSTSGYAIFNINTELLNIIPTTTSSSPQVINSFLLDPMRGYPAGIDIGMLCEYTPVVLKFWFVNSNLNNMLAVGQANLYFPGNLSAILNIQVNPQKYSIAYNNLLSFQMSWYNKYKTFINEKLVDLWPDRDVMMPFFYQDASCTFFATPAIAGPKNSWFFYEDLEAMIKADTTGLTLTVWYTLS